MMKFFQTDHVKITICINKIIVVPEHLPWFYVENTFAGKLIKKITNHQYLPVYTTRVHQKSTAFTTFALFRASRHAVRVLVKAASFSVKQKIFVVSFIHTSNCICNRKLSHKNCLCKRTLVFSSKCNLDPRASFAEFTMFCLETCVCHLLDEIFDQWDKPTVKTYKTRDNLITRSFVMGRRTKFNHRNNTYIECVLVSFISKTLSPKNGGFRTTFWLIL